MRVRAFVGVTDRSWYAYLATRPTIGEVNFWQPSGRGFRAVQIGEPFLFKTRYLDNRLVGGGFFSGQVRLKTSEAWDFYGEGNGTATLGELRERIKSYRRSAVSELDDPEIGCVLLRDVTFFPPEEQERPPEDFARNIVQGKTYDLQASDPTDSVHRAVYRLLAPGVYQLDELATQSHPGPMFSDARITRGRLGQHAFQAMILQAYGRRCAVTGDKIRPVLQAAHIKPVAAGGEHRLDNGLLLRSDVHTLLDRGYLSVDFRHRLLVSPRLRREFANGDEFYRREGNSLEIPRARSSRPNREFLEWHADSVFLAS